MSFPHWLLIQYRHSQEKENRNQIAKIDKIWDWFFDDQSYCTSLLLLDPSCELRSLAGVKHSGLRKNETGEKREKKN